MNARGKYGTSIYVGQAGFNTPGEIAAGLDQFDAELDQFDWEVFRNTDAATSRETRQIAAVPAHKALVAKEKHIQDLVSRLAPGSQERAAMEKVRIDAWLEVMKDVDRRLRATQDPVLAWRFNSWQPFVADWREFYGNKSIYQRLPGRNVWELVQEFRRKLVSLRNRAPFKAGSSEPLPPPPPSPSQPESPPSLPSPASPPSSSVREDSKSPGTDVDVGTIAKYALIGGLVLGGTFLVAKLSKA